VKEEVKVRVSLPVRNVPKLSTKEKKELASYARSLGNKLKSQQVGKSGVTANSFMAFGDTLERNELLKAVSLDFGDALKFVLALFIQAACFSLGKFRYYGKLFRIYKATDLDIGNVVTYLVSAVTMWLNPCKNFLENSQLKIHGTCPVELDDVVDQLEKATGSVAVGRIGRTVILYRPSFTKLKDAQNKKPPRTSKPPSMEREARSRNSNRGQRGSSRFSLRCSDFHRTIGEALSSSMHLFPASFRTNNPVQKKLSLGRITIQSFRTICPEIGIPSPEIISVLCRCTGKDQIQRYEFDELYTGQISICDTLKKVNCKGYITGQVQINRYLAFEGSSRRATLYRPSTSRVSPLVVVDHSCGFFL
ncbi:hypothetical protein AKJ16_DCAP24137, partial [Drosera capensis]